MSNIAKTIKEAMQRIDENARLEKETMQAAESSQDAFKTKLPSITPKAIDTLVTHVEDAFLKYTAEGRLSFADNNKNQKFYADSFKNILDILYILRDKPEISTFYEKHNYDALKSIFLKIQDIVRLGNYESVRYIEGLKNSFEVAIIIKEQRDRAQTPFLNIRSAKANMGGIEVRSEKMEP